MGIRVSERVEVGAGSALVAGGGALGYVGMRQISNAASMQHYVAPKMVVPALEQLERSLAVASSFTNRLVQVMDNVQIPGQDRLSGVPLLGGLAKEAERAAQLTVVAREVSKLDHRGLLDASRVLGDDTAKLITASKEDLAKIGGIKKSAISGGAKLAIAGAIASMGGLLLAHAAFDFD